MVNSMPYGTITSLGLHFLSVSLLVVPALSSSFQPFDLRGFNGTVLSDGSFTFCHNPFILPDAIYDTTMLRYRSQLRPNLLALNILAVDIGGRRVLVDTGAFTPSVDAPLFANAGQLITNMRHAGLAPDSVDAVLLTHAHADHVLGMVVANGSAPTFPNARVYISAKDHDFWSDPTNDTDVDPVDVGT